MGQRGKSAVFMPDKYVFPGGAVDPADAVHSQDALSSTCRTRLTASLRPEAAPLGPDALVAAALRELAEETGQRLKDPAAAHLRFFFRAITPEGRPRRFDARFFLAHAADLTTDPDDFSGADDELRHLVWVPLEEARRLDLPFVTEVVLAELAAQNSFADGVPLLQVQDGRGQVSFLA